MFRSGPLTRRRLIQILAKVQLHPHDLKSVAKACMIYPADLMAWYVLGQDPECKSRLYVELAWGVNNARFERAARNLERIEAAANGGKKTKVVTKPHPLALEIGNEDNPAFKPVVEVTVEDVLPAAWAIEKLEALQAGSHWEISPNAEQAAELHAMMRELEPTPLLVAGQQDPNVADPPVLSGAVGPLAGGDGGGEVEGAEGAGDVPVVGIGGEALAAQEQAGRGVDGLEADEEGAGRVGLDGKLNDVVHTQTLTDD